MTAQSRDMNEIYEYRCVRNVHR